MLAIIISLFLKSTQRAGSCFPWVQRDCGAQQASFCLAVNFAGPLSTSREAVGAVGLVAVWRREVERWGKCCIRLRIWLLPPTEPQDLRRLLPPDTDQE